MAEVLWSHPARRDYEAFRARLEGHYDLLEALGYQYDVEEVPVTLKSSNESFNEKLEVRAIATPAFANLDLSLSASTGIISDSAATFTARGLHTLMVQPQREGRAMGPNLQYDFALHEGLLTHSCLTSSPTPPYTGTNDIPLANGVLGSTNFRDGKWLGYSKYPSHFPSLKFVEPNTPFARGISLVPV